MNEWDKRVKEHLIFGEMEAFGTAIDAASKVSEVGPDLLVSIERLRAVLTYAGKRLAAADPLITPMDPLQNIYSAFSQARHYVLEFIHTKNTANIQTANGIVDGALPLISAIPGAYTPEELGAAVQSTERYRSTMDGAISSAQSAVSEFNHTSEVFRTRLADVSAKLEAESQRLSNISAEYQSQFSVAQDSRTREFTSALSAAQDSINKLSTDFLAQFSAAQSSRQTKYDDLEASYKDRISKQDSAFAEQLVEVKELHDNQIESLTSTYSKNAEGILSLLKQRQGEVEKIVGVVGNLTTTSGYLRVANRAQTGTYLWQTLTVLSMAILSVLAYRTLKLLEDSSGHFNWGAFSARALLLLSLGVIAAYSSSQADKLFTEEKRNRKLALELEAIGPYLAPLPIEEQHKFRLAIGERSFGRHEIELAHKKSPASLLDLLRSKEGKDVLDFIIDLLKKAK